MQVMNLGLVMHCSGLVPVRETLPLDSEDCVFIMEQRTLTRVSSHRFVMGRDDISH